MTRWAPQTPSGFVARDTPPAIRKIVPRRFSTHFFLPMVMNEETKDRAILTISLSMPECSTLHASTVVSRSELEGGAAGLYERFVIGATTALDNRVSKGVAA